MLTIAVVILAFTVIPAPWGWIAVLGAATIDVVETVVLVRWSKRRTSAVGAEALVGRTAVVVRPLTPRGQVKLDGEVWEARAGYDLLPGEEVRIVGLDGLVLDVEPL